MVLNPDLEDIYVIDTYTIDITWKDGSQCCCPLDVDEAQFDIIPETLALGNVWWGTYDFTGTGTSSGYYDGSFNVTDGHEQWIEPMLLPAAFEGVANEGYAVLGYTCDEGVGWAKGYNIRLPEPDRFQEDLKFKGAIEASARGFKFMWAGPLTLTVRHCIPEGPAPTPTPVGHCFIATAAYGTEAAAEIDVLRAFRDEVLLESTVGSQLVELYYQTSPPVADFISENSLLRTIVRELVIDPMVSVATFTQGIWGK